MKHTTLYRKWRPRRFGEVAGQEAVVRTLRRAIETDRVAHAYLFSGPRGTGKTSTAKVLAMGLNCVDGPTPEPDGTCESCRAIVNNSSMDVVEMDAASNRGIDEIRDLRDRVNLAPVSGRMKVYIIDEVHMLTTEAFNALLKMLEEPPEHVIFVLATTEKHRVLPTIISRCQSFDFRRPGVPVLSEKLAEIAEAEGIEVEPEALTVIAGAGGGSFRDAEGLLDQLSSFADGPVTAAMVRELLGSVGSGTLIETTDALYERRTADALRIVERLSNEGKDLGQFVGEMLSHLRNVMLLPHAPEVALAEVGAEDRAPLEEQASRVPTAEVVRTVEALGDARGRIRRGGDAKMELELTFLKLTRDYTEPSVDALLQRLETLEKAVENGSFASEAPLKNSREVDEEQAGSVDEPQAENPLTENRAEEDAAAATVKEPAREEREAPGSELDWGLVVRRLKERSPAIAAVYDEAMMEGFEDGILRLAFPEELAIYTKLAVEPKRLKSVQEILEEHLGESPRLEFSVSGGGGTNSVGAAPARENPPTPVPATHEQPRKESPGTVEAAREPDGDTIGQSAAPTGDRRDEDIVHDPQEVLAMAREEFGTNLPNEGSRV